ncbi:crotonase/enoyl-CoA hydratase family protein [Desulfocastanea catecholica]
MNNDFFRIFREYKQITLRYDVQHRAIWCYYNPTPRPCFSISMLQEIWQYLQSVIDYFSTNKANSDSPIRYLVVQSRDPDIFSMGGDLALFSKLIREQNRQQLLDYAKQCIDILYQYSVNLHLPITTISLVEGAALGGGFECALSGNVLFATENAEMGFPEIRFNLFPGMGAYSFLARVCGAGMAERIIANGRTYSAKELHEMGIVNFLSETGKGVVSVEKFMSQHQQWGNGLQALQQVKQCYNPINYQELLKITEIWADAALRLNNDNLRFIDRLVKAQSIKMSKLNSKTLLRTKQDRRFTQGEMIFPLSDFMGKIIPFDRRSNPDRRFSNLCN